MKPGRIVQIVGYLIILALLVLLILGWRGIGPLKFKGAEAERGDWQAVFLSNGQVYFGHLSEMDKPQAKLAKIYYLQTEQPVQPAKEGEAQQPKLTLVKLGKELHGPQDLMYINRDHIMFWENLKDDGNVVQAIKDFEAKEGQGETPSPTAAPTETPTPTSTKK